MENGHVVQRGRHEEMIRINGPYSQLLRTGEGTQADMSFLLDLFQADEA